jgi:hypothetical protein
LDFLFFGGTLRELNMLLVLTIPNRNLLNLAQQGCFDPRLSPPGAPIRSMHPIRFVISSDAATLQRLATANIKEA